jgi:hypothetical protein
MKSIKIICSIIVVGVLFLNFQNCSNSSDNRGPASSVEQLESQTDSGTEVESETPESTIAPTFKAEDDFNIALVKPLTAMLKTQHQELNYTKFLGAKAIAINKNGIGFVSLKAEGHDEEAKRTALQSCFSIGRGQPCALLAVGNKFVVSSAELPASYKFFVDKKSILDDDIPFATDSKTDTVLASYKLAKSPKALAISLDGALISVTSDSEVGLNKTIAKNLALQRCELRASISPCAVYAVNDDVVFDPANMESAPSIDYYRTKVEKSIPGVSPDRFQKMIGNKYLKNLKKSHGAIFVTKSGEVATAMSSVSQVDANEKARKKCQEFSSRSSCFQYAEKTRVLNLVTNLSANMFSHKIHCTVVPRRNCQDHVAMGCKGKNVYILDKGVPQRVRCD